MKAVTYSIFDNKVGPRLKCCYPKHAVSEEMFEAYSDFVIVSKQLCEKLILVTFEDVQFLNYSVAIDNQKYDRNTLNFAFGFVIAKGVNVEPYESVLRKVSSTFVDLELECEYLFQQEKSQERVEVFVRLLYEQLQARNEAFIDMGVGGNFLAVKLYRSPVEPFPVMDFDVPMFRRDIIDLAALPWDISFQHLVPHIDGISHVRKIVKEVGMDPDSVKRSLAMLLFYEAIIISDVFKFTNVYKLHTQSAMLLLSDGELIHEMQHFSAASTRTGLTSGTGSRGACGNIPSGNQLINLLLRLQPMRTLEDVILSSLDSRNGSIPIYTRQSQQHGGGNSGGSGELSSDRNPGSSHLAAGEDNTVTEPAVTEATAAATATATATAALSSEANQSLQGTGDDPAEGPAEETLNGVLDLRNMNIARALAFAKAKGIIKRLHEYPVYIPTPAQLQIKLQREQLQQQQYQQHHQQFDSGAARNSGGFDDINTKQQQQRRTPSFDAAERDCATSAATGMGTALPTSSSTGITVFPSASTNQSGAADGAPIPAYASGPGFPPSQPQQQQQQHREVQLPPHYFQRLTTRARSLLRPGPGIGGNSISRDSMSHYSGASSVAGAGSSAGATVAATGAAVAAAQYATMAPAYVEVQDILAELDGSEHLDSLCCRYELTYHDVVNYPGVHLIYK